MAALLTTVFVASLLGSLHCVGMCGGFVAFYSGADGSGGARRLLSHAAYSGSGRAGLLGPVPAPAMAPPSTSCSTTSSAGRRSGGRDGDGRVGRLRPAPNRRSQGLQTPFEFENLGMATPRHHPRGEPPPGRPGSHRRLVVRCPALRLALGVRGLQPGWFNRWAALRIMAVFWAGTVPMLLALGLGAQVLSIPLRRHIPAITAVILVALGLYAIIGRPTTRARRHDQTPAHGRGEVHQRTTHPLLRRLNTSMHNGSAKTARSRSAAKGC